MKHETHAIWINAPLATKSLQTSEHTWQSKSHNSCDYYCIRITARGRTSYDILWPTDLIFIHSKPMITTNKADDTLWHSYHAPFFLFARTFDKVMWPAQININIRLWPWPTPIDICTFDLCTAWLPYKHDPLPHSLSITNLHVHMTSSIEADHFWSINTHHLKPAQVWSICTYMWPAQTNTSATNVYTGLHKQWSHWTFFKLVWYLKGGESGSQKSVRQSLQLVNYMSLIQSCIWLECSGAARM